MPKISVIGERFASAPPRPSTGFRCGRAHIDAWPKRTRDMLYLLVNYRPVPCFCRARLSPRAAGRAAHRIVFVVLRSTRAAARTARAGAALVRQRPYRACVGTVRDRQRRVRTAARVSRRDLAIRKPKKQTKRKKIASIVSAKSTKRRRTRDKRARARLATQHTEPSMCVACSQDFTPATAAHALHDTEIL